MSERSAKSATMRVKLRYATVDQFLVKYGPNISRGGIFIATKSPKAVGTPIRFEFVLVNGDVEVSVLRGEGTVHFVRDAEGGKTPGMGVKFTKLYDEGQALIDRALRLKTANAEITPPPPSDLPQGVREVTGEVELHSGSHPTLEPPPPDVPTPEAPPNVPTLVGDTAPMDVTDQQPTLPPNVPPPELPPRAALETPGATPARGPDVEALLGESGVSVERVNALLDRRRRPRVAVTDEAIEALRRRDPLEETSAAEAVARLDALLRRR